MGATVKFLQQGSSKNKMIGYLAVGRIVVDEIIALAIIDIVMVRQDSNSNIGNSGKTRTTTSMTDKVYHVWENSVEGWFIGIQLTPNCRLCPYKGREESL